MIFIAGISPKKKVLDQNPRRCPVCGLSQAYYMRIDHYLSFFFIPLFRIKKGEPFIMCDRCQRSFDEFAPDFNRRQQESPNICRSCGKALDQEFKYCPQCGKRV